MADHHLSDHDDNVHVGFFDNALDPALTVDPGDVVALDCRDAPNGYFDRSSTAADLADKPSTGHPVTGPVRVDGASPGDVLEIEIVDVDHHGWGVSYFYPSEADKGLLAADFDEPGFHFWDLEGDVGHFVDGIEVPLAPFPGVVGLAPAAEGRHSTTPPRRVGGNLDCKHLTAGSTLYLPVEVDGALASVGDGHGAQGDGEVCVTGIEAPTTVTARFDVHEGMDIDQPQFETTGPFAAGAPDDGYYGTTGIADDLMTATKLAVRHMIDHLEAERGLTRAEAYILCSTAVDLKLTEVVNAPNWTVSAYLPEAVFPA